MDEYITAVEASEKWGITTRRIQVLCKQGRIPGSTLFGHTWAIPTEAQKPEDARVKSGKYVKKQESADDEKGTEN